MQNSSIKPLTIPRHHIIHEQLSYRRIITSTNRLSGNYHDRRMIFSWRGEICMRYFQVLSVILFAVSLLANRENANATPLNFSYSETGNNGINFSFDQASNPVPLGEDGGIFTIIPVSNWSGNVGPFSSIVWYNATDLGLFDTADHSTAVYGPQVYSGTEANPVFAPGQFTGIDHDNGNTGTLVVTAAVPEPSAWAFMVVGLGMVGLIMRKRPVGLSLGRASA